MATITGGDKLQTALAKIAADLAKSATLRVGFLEGATYPDGKPVAMIAAIQEYGAPARHIPPRPFFRNMVAANSKGWAKLVAVALKNRDYDAASALELAGEVIRGELQQAIRDFSGVPLAPATVAKKGSDKQLIDTGHMLNSVDYEVKA
jgi:hypothetical protein